MTAVRHMDERGIIPCVKDQQYSNDELLDLCDLPRATPYRAGEWRSSGSSWGTFYQRHHLTCR